MPHHKFIYFYFYLQGEDAKFDEDGFRRVRAYLEGLDKWTLCTAEVVGGLCKSISMGLACIKGFRTAEQLSIAARVEENFQISQWGTPLTDLKRVFVCVYLD